MNDGPAPLTTAPPSTRRPSSFAITGKVTADHHLLKELDPVTQEIVLEEIHGTDANQDGVIDRDEFIGAMKKAALRARECANRELHMERKLKKSHQKIMGLSALSMLLVFASTLAIYFAVDRGNTQVKSAVMLSTESVLDSQDTHVSSDAAGTPHLVDRHGEDISVRAEGIVAVATYRELRSGREVTCVPIHDVARAVNGLSSSTEASLLVSDGDGNTRDILPLSGAFHDHGSEMSFGGGSVFVHFDSTDCDANAGVRGDGGKADASGDPFNRYLRKTERAASRADVLREKREQYASSLEAVRRGQRSLQDTYSVSVMAYSSYTCNSSYDQFSKSVFKALISRVTQESVLDDDSESAQSRALDWIANSDQIHPALIPGIDDEQIIQRYILAAFYFAVNGDRNSNLADWLSYSPVCNSDDWAGVQCAPGAGGSSVTGLGLSDFGLDGVLIPELGSLNSLRILNLSDNAIFGTIPVELGGLDNLQTLVLTTNGLTGSIPTQLGSLPVLKNLGLNINELSNTIPTEIGNLAGLEMLKLQHNELTGEIPAEIGGLSSLKEADFSQNSLVGRMPARVCSLKSGNRWFTKLDADCAGSPPEVLCYRPCCTNDSCPSKP